MHTVKMDLGVDVGRFSPPKKENLLVFRGNCWDEAYGRTSNHARRDWFSPRWAGDFLGIRCFRPHHVVP